MNALAEWLEKRGGAAAKRELQRRIEEKTGRPIRWATIHDIARGAVVPTPDTAKRIEAATDGEVTAAQLLGISGDESSTPAGADQPRGEVNTVEPAA
ncbi:hypothetical protein [Sandaracinus amylolyticus]|uniref:HTH cro/C1-type domain-containing protein n=1 Tax=Sandaracinus amylolyticus TaxID=927083 RepID=A0A0F6SEZ6_9BACT|nr:hypothetical protein [Sandaracinus amylolyticus]AKF06059.1 hypothetical protein DB32_003208 [Sandaracinus amylolyticus]